MNIGAHNEELLTAHNELVERLTVLANNPELEEQQELARAWRDRLESERERAIAPLSIAFVAQVGRGKSTLIAAATGLRLAEEGTPRKWSVLPVGDGRTTLGETHIKFESRDDILLEVEPFTLETLRTELRIFASDLWAARAGGSTNSSSSRAGEEFFGLLRAWLARDDQDPRAVLEQLTHEATSEAALTKLLLARVDLEQRSRSYSHAFSADPEGLGALKTELKQLMRGELPEAPAPRLTRLRLPSRDPDLIVDTIIDTQGLDSAAPELLIRGRPDLQRLLTDPDTLLVVCSEFESAPDLVSQKFLEAIAEQPGKTRLEEQPWRLVIVDRRALDDDPDERARDRHLRDDRVAVCRDVLRRKGVSLTERSVVAIDARHETAAVQQLLVDMTREERLRREDAWRRRLTDAEEAIAVLRDVEFTMRARELDLRLWWIWDAALTKHAATASADPDRWQGGLNGIAIGIEHGQELQHWSHLNAAVRRRGIYSNLDLTSLGARFASAYVLYAYTEAIDDMKRFVKDTKGTLSPRLAEHLDLRLHTFEEEDLRCYRELKIEWKRVLREYFASPRSNELWNACTARWGQGGGYVEDVTDRFRQESKRADLQLPHTPTPLESRLPPRPYLFRLRSLALRNFRAIMERAIGFAATTTVLVGDNGLGKTTWLEGVAATVGALLPGVGAGAAPELSGHDVRQVIREINGVPDRQHQLPMTLEVEATIQGSAITWTRKIETLGTAVTEDEGLQVITRAIGDEIRAHAERQLPVLAYYGTQRLWPPNLEPDAERREVGNRLDGYRDCLKAASTHRHMLDWMRHFTLVELQRKKPVVQLRAVERAVTSCVEDAEGFHYDLALEELVLTMRDGRTLSFRMLSDGYRNIVAMVADIAWRASVLNPQLGARAPSLAEGVVIIDEIDLHLHPKWQRRVLADLRRAFPRLQIVTTTHSPFIIQSLNPGELVNLDENAEAVPYADLSPEDIAEHIMGVDLPQRSERRRKEFEAATRYYELLEQIPDADETELARLKAELDKLQAPYAENQAFVAFLERKRMLAEAQRA